MIVTDDVYDEVLREVAKARHPGSRSVHPSSLTCQRKIVFQLLGFPQRSRMSPDSRISLDTGSALHRMIQEHLEKGLPLVHPGTRFETEVRIDERYPRARELCLHGYADGVIHTPIDRTVFEIKTTGTNELTSIIASKRPRAAHLEQVNLYMWCLEIPKGSVMYMSSQNTKLRRTFPVGFDSDLWKKTEAKIRGAMEAATEGRFPPVDTTAWTCKICPHSYACARKKEWCDEEDLRTRADGVLDPGEGEGAPEGDGDAGA